MEEQMTSYASAPLGFQNGNYFNASLCWSDSSDVFTGIENDQSPLSTQTHSKGNAVFLNQPVAAGSSTCTGEPDNWRNSCLTTAAGAFTGMDKPDGWRNSPEKTKCSNVIKMTKPRPKPKCPIKRRNQRTAANVRERTRLKRILGKFHPPTDSLNKRGMNANPPE